MSTVTNRNKTAPHLLKCNASGLLLSDATPQFEIISITQQPKLALIFPTLEAVEKAQKIITALYGSFDWQPVAA
ncbi:MAG: hypothetical protein V4448_17635 [Pseudomonadota bacterium]